MLFFELFGEVVDNAQVKVFTAEECITIGRQHFKHAVADLEQGDIKCTAAKVIDRDDLIGVFVETVGQRCSGRLVDDAQYFEASNLTSVLWWPDAERR